MDAKDAPPAPDDRGIALPIAIWIGGKRRTMIGRLQLAGVLSLLATVAAIPLTVGIGTWADHQSLRKEWTVVGAACPEVPKIAIAARGAKPPAPFVFQGVAFAFEIGDVYCEPVPDGWFTGATHPVCQFDHPAAIKVTTAGRTVIYQPGVGHKATVTIRAGRPSCAMGGWF